MTTTTLNVNGNLLCNNLNTWGIITGDGSGLTNVPLSTGTQDYVAVYTGASGALSEEQRLATWRGGTAIDTSLSTGIAKVSTGTWSVSTLVDADVNATAAISRTKIASGTNNHFVINNGSGVLSSTGFLNASTADLQLTPTTDVIVGNNNSGLYFNNSKLNGFKTSTVSTSNNTVTTLFTLTTSPNTKYTLWFDVIANNTTDSQSGIYKGFIKIDQGAATTTPTISSIANYSTILDLSMLLTTISTSGSADTFNLRVTGVAAKTINWKAFVFILGYA